MKKPISYTPDQLQGKFVSVSKVLSEKCPALTCVIYTSGEHTGLPVLYDSIQAAKSDRYFDPLWDEVMPASEYFNKINSGINQVI